MREFENNYCQNKGKKHHLQPKAQNGRRVKVTTITRIINQYNGAVDISVVSQNGPNLFSIAVDSIFHKNLQHPKPWTIILGHCWCFFKVSFRKSLTMKYCQSSYLKRLCGGKYCEC